MPFAVTLLVAVGGDLMSSCLADLRVKADERIAHLRQMYGAPQQSRFHRVQRRKIL